MDTTLTSVNGALESTSVPTTIDTTLTYVDGALESTSVPTTINATLTSVDGTLENTSAPASAAVAESCAADRMVCPLPADLSSYPYAIKGSEAVDACQIQGTAPYRFFNVSLHQCNFTTTFWNETGFAVDVLELVPHGLQDNLWPVVFCRCWRSVQWTGSVGPVELPSTPAPRSIELEGLWAVNLGLFTEDCQREVKAGEPFPVASSRFCLRASMPMRSEKLAFESCIASASGLQEDFFSQLFSAKFLDGGCADETFEVVTDQAE
eukprot:CAMPEP_0170612242 /NCGR_PEP_ID=MMETSP0224-20130122/23619_1 /TAXON_ID=285029 /ORGANISM="Togula jolla, Strain CCCM 725" /LENGTH=264 /DNA_ID=CAMNT_0010937733 /DNA_START=24 /DNA_END=815 /DNA_ORIENTATION=+